MPLIMRRTGVTGHAFTAKLCRIAGYTFAEIFLSLHSTGKAVNMLADLVFSR